MHTEREEPSTDTGEEDEDEHKDDEVLDKDSAHSKEEPEDRAPAKRGCSDQPRINAVLSHFR
eukprot:6958422-Karenia_brevis.AAC.1